MSLLDVLSSRVGDAFESLGLDRAAGTVVPSQRPELCQFQCNGVLAVAKKAGRKPQELAVEARDLLVADDRFEAVDIAGPGFINISVTDAFLAEVLAAVAADDALGVGPLDPPLDSIVLDYGGPNVAKDLHVGHLRTALIGESLKRLYLLTGAKAVGDVHLGDWGLPMGQLIAALEDLHPELPYFDEAHTGPWPETSPVTIDDLQRLYPEASGRAKEDPEFEARAQRATVELQQGRPGYRALWQHLRQVSVDALRATYDRLGVDFDYWLGESAVADQLPALIDELTRSGLAVESDGAVVIDVSEATDTKEMPPLMLQNSRGGATYAATDLATVRDRVETLQPDLIVYVVDRRQALHFEQVFRAARRSGIAGDDLQLVHAGNGTVNGPDGRPFKTREGGLPRLSALLDEVQTLALQRLDEGGLAQGFEPEERNEIARLVGLGAMKFGELSNHRTTDYSFDLERFTLLSGSTGPYLQYVAVRAGSVLARAADAGLSAGRILAPSDVTERDLTLVILGWPDVVRRAAATFAPNMVAEYAYELAVAFNRFYGACHILSEPDAALQASRIAIVALTRRLLVTALGVLTIDVPDRM